MNRWFLTLLIASFAMNAMAESARYRRSTYRESVNNLETLEEPRTKEMERHGRFLASESPEDDLTHYHAITRRLGIDLGMMMPFGDYQREFSPAPLIGIHLSWDAIPPLTLNVAMKRASAPQKNDPNSAKLSVNTINIGAAANFPMKRFLPFVKLEGVLLFNDVSFNDGRRITSGNDINLTTIGICAGLGVDFVVGREVSIGLDVNYHYSVPKKLTLTDGTNTSTFDLGAPFATVGLRVNF